MPNAKREIAVRPYSMRLVSGAGSVAQNAGVPLTSQSSNGDSARQGQFYNALGYLGVNSPYGTVTLFRQTALTSDGVAAYDPLGGSYAFSPRPLRKLMFRERAQTRPLQLVDSNDMNPWTIRVTSGDFPASASGADVDVFCQRVLIISQVACRW